MRKHFKLAIAMLSALVTLRRFKSMGWPRHLAAVMNGGRMPSRKRRATFHAARSIFLILALCLAIIFPSSGYARLIFDSNDPDFAGATLEPFDPSVIPVGATSFTLVNNGVTFTFTTQDPAGLFRCFGGNCILDTRSSAIDIAISPPVAAIGFQYLIAECRGVATFTGSLGTETFQAPLSGQRGFFVGAAGIGDISSVRLTDSCVSAAQWDDMLFVPSSAPPPTPTPTPAPLPRADLSVGKTGPNFTHDSASNLYDIRVDNQGPDTANGIRVVDFLPFGFTYETSFPAATLNQTGNIATLDYGNLDALTGMTGLLRILSPPFFAPPGSPRLGCESVTTNVALVTSSTIDPNTSDNLSIAVARFDRNFRVGVGEICGNGVDDDCDGRADCADSACNCLPPITAAPAPPPCVIIPGVVNTCVPTAPPVPAPQPPNREAQFESCGPFDDGHGGTITLLPFCCDGVPNTFSQTIRCRVPLDPNFKEADPAVNAAGYGFTQAGRTMTYTLHYENIGNADAHDVSVIDILPLDLDSSTLVINNGGTYDPTNRALVWRDPVVPPATPRSVSFSVNVGATAPHGTRIRNTGTVIFPDAVPPSRIDTNFTEHFVLAPGHQIEPVLKVFQCTQTAPGSDEWQVKIVNDGYGFGYNVTASILNAPASVNVIDGMASFAHPQDPNPSQLATVIPLAATTSIDTVRFNTQTLADPCGALTWRISYQNSGGQAFTRNVQQAPDADADAVADADDNCPAVFNPTQADTDGDGLGDACENSAPDCSLALPSRATLWPPNHRMRAVSILGVTDPDDDPVSISIDRIMQDEPTSRRRGEDDDEDCDDGEDDGDDNDGGGDGNTCPDARGVGTSTALLRAERSGRGNGRVYTIFFTATDGRGGSCQSSVKVVVPQDRRHAAIDDGPAYDSTVCRR